MAYIGIQVQAQNTARLSQLHQWEKLFELHRATHGDYPAMPTGPQLNPGASKEGYYCLGTGFPADQTGTPRCRDYQFSYVTYAVAESTNSDLMLALGEFGTLPRGPYVPVTSTVGPYAYYSYHGYILLVGVFNASTVADCPEGTIGNWSDGDKAMCYIRLDP